jgi:hypothetical protein
MKIVIIADHGCIRSVYCDEEAEVVILDYDEVEAQDTKEENNALKADYDHEAEIAEQTMHEVF